ncbi:hypothetical protein ARMGADRAFT_675655 [Armillaria gallica]|uniref:Uncharacterized protein n=1 Tax=Armillaria gallica TaxID=47427 RepID=A0A2H3D4V7_ARMGA|nr:hypothetical protein ARMGADRAFT_675655 [Armillaria gallica]
MANIIRSTRPGSHWTTNDLEAYNIVVREQNEAEREYFLWRTSSRLSRSCRLSSARVRNRQTRCGTELTSQALEFGRRHGGRGRVDCGRFVAELLRVLGYEMRGTVVCTPRSIRFLMCGLSRELCCRMKVRC